MEDGGVRNGSILRVLRGARLPCGCVTGIYETYAGTTVAVIDEVHADCGLAQHRNGCMMSIASREASTHETSTS
jgi:hypothetical protein